MRLDKTKALLVLADLALLGLIGWVGFDLYRFQRGPNRGVETLSKQLSSSFEEALRTRERLANLRGWDYMDPQNWAHFWTANLIGKEPPPPPEPVASKPVEPPKPKSHPPIGEVIDLLSIFGFPGSADRPGEGFVVIEYKKPVEQAGALDRGTPSGMLAAGALSRDMIALSQPLRPPFELWTVKELLRDGSGARFVWDGKDAEVLRLAEISASAMAETEEELTNWNSGGTPASRPGPGATRAQGRQDKGWVPVQGMKPVLVAPNDWSLSEDLARDFERSPDDWIASVRLGAQRLPEATRLRNKGQENGLAVGRVAGRAAELGLEEGMILISLNGHPITNKAELINVGKRLYNQGVRVFQARVLHYGREETLTVRAPDR